MKLKFQGIEYDDIAGNFIMLGDYHIIDYPEFKHRGVHVDTSRNFVSVEVLKRIIDGASASKVIFRTY